MRVDKQVRGNWELEEKLDSFDVAASFKSRRWRNDVVLERGRASYWRRNLIALAALHGTTETKCT